MPQGTELARLTKKTAVSYIYVGKPQKQVAGAKEEATAEGYCVQINDRIVSTNEVANLIAAERKRLSDEDRPRQMVSLQADCNAPMWLITDIKQALRKANVRRINYSADEKK